MSLRVTVVFIYLLLARLLSHTIVITRSPPGGFYHHISSKNERIQTKLDRKKLRQQGNPQENIACMAPPGGETTPFLSAYMSPARLTPS